MLLSQKKATAAVEMASEQAERPKWHAQIKWNRENREARRAHAIVAEALKAGTLKRGKCWCGSLRVEGHHESYDRPLDVTWLCRKHHRAVHTAQRRSAKAEAQT